MIHLAFLKPQFFDQIRRGEKRVEVRVSVRRHAALKTNAGDSLCFKENGCNRFIVAEVARIIKIENPNNANDITQLMESIYPPALNYIRSKSCIKSATFLFFETSGIIGTIEKPVPLSLGQQGWIHNFSSSLHDLGFSPSN